MPPKKRRAAQTSVAASRPRRSTRQSTTTKPGNGIPDVYQEMLSEAAAQKVDEEFTIDERPNKRRRVGIEEANSIDDLFEPTPAQSVELAESQPIPELQSRPQQVVYDDFEGSDDSDAEFEDVELEAAAPYASEDESLPQKSLHIDLSRSTLETPKRTVQRRKPVSKAERELRLDVHKWHFLSLVGHGVQRNSWCNDSGLQTILKPFVPRKIIKLLHVDEAKPQYERNHSFNKGVEELCAIWRQQWKTTTQGLRRAYWRDGVDALEEVDESEDLELEDFIDAARTLHGSRDLGAQLFTALLRSVAVDARLVFSLQILPFTGSAKSETSSKPSAHKDYIYAPAQNYGASTSEVSPFMPPQPRRKKSKKIVDSPYPIFWTEVMTPNHTWIPLDPIVRNSIAKPKTQFEPPLSDNLNSMTYVIAYEENNSARDVTRRYAQWYNAKTRRTRVESTKNGEQWYTSAMSVLHKRIREPRDEIEDDELARRANSEGMPHNIQDFKNHPVYVLERHMRMNEVLQPRREVGKVNVGTTKNGKLESVYRRKDVHLCRTADAWYRRGRDVKMGEQPLKHVIPKSQRRVRGASVNNSDDEDDDESDGVGLYAEYQTVVYEPPSVINGRIPKNAYGNLDVYVPSMIPPGAVHISHTLAATAAKILAIDFAEAVTGFEFKGRQGTAIVNGVVVAEQFTAAVAAVIGSLEALGSEEVQQTRSRILTSLWKRMLHALRVRERVEVEYGSTNPSYKKKGRESEGTNEDDDDEEDSTYQDDESGDDAGGGFMPDDEPTEEKIQEQTTNLQALKAKMPAILPEEVVSVPIKITRSPHKSRIKAADFGQTRAVENMGDDTELFEDDEHLVLPDGNAVPTNGDSIGQQGGFLAEDTTADTAAGGFFAEDDEQGGGFVLEDNPAAPPNPYASSSSRVHQHPRMANQPTPSLHDMDLLHSDAEEDTALQLAIAQSLAPSAPTPDPDPNDPDNENDPNTDINTAHIAAGTTASDPIKSVATEPPSANELLNSKSIPGSGSPSSTSLLSHDPNEDDEEPEWLNEALDD